MSNILNVRYDSKPIYDINITDDFSSIIDSITGFMIPGRKVCIISDTNVSKFHLDDMIRLLESDPASTFLRIDSYVIEAGERSKNTDNILSLIKYLIERKYDRNDLLIALGGGVIGDMTGFAAAIYLRGIRFVQVPTSLLAMVDSSIGGKTGVDLDGYKNMVGAFHMPKYVHINVNALKTLPEREYISGFAEIIKHAVIKSSDYFEYLYDNVCPALEKDVTVLKKIIYDSCVIKRDVVEEDPLEKGIRAYLNFGHTIGHAIEKYYDFSLLHGECVSLGMVVSSYISYKKGLITLKTHEKIREILRAYGLPVDLSDIRRYSDIEFNPDEIIRITANDKKADGNMIKYVLINDIGSVYIDKTVTPDMAKNALREAL